MRFFLFRFIYFLAVMVFAANQMDVIPGSMVGSIGAMFAIGIIVGVILNKIIPPIMGVSIHAFAYMVILLAVSNMIGLIPQTVKDGSKKLQGFFAGQLSWVA